MPACNTCISSQMQDTMGALMVFLAACFTVLSLIATFALSSDQIIEMWYVNVTIHQKCHKQEGYNCIMQFLKWNMGLIIHCLSSNENWSSLVQTICFGRFASLAPPLFLLWDLYRLQGSDQNFEASTWNKFENGNSLLCFVLIRHFQMCQVFHLGWNLRSILTRTWNWCIISRVNQFSKIYLPPTVQMLMYVDCCPNSICKLPSSKFASQAILFWSVLPSALSECCNLMFSHYKPNDKQLNTVISILCAQKRPNMSVLFDFS